MPQSAVECTASASIEPEPVIGGRDVLGDRDGEVRAERVEDRLGGIGAARHRLLSASSGSILYRAIRIPDLSAPRAGVPMATHFTHDPDGPRLPVKLDTTTNGEFAPIPLSPVHHRRANARASSAAATTRSASASTAAASSSRRAASRRRSSASTRPTRASGRRGGFYELPRGGGARPPRRALARSTATSSSSTCRATS